MNDERMICRNLVHTDEGKLRFAGFDTRFLAEKYGTPLYLMDEDRIREQCRAYIDSVRSAFGNKGKVLYASKACSFKKMYEIVGQEGICIDVVSCGEIYTAMKAGFPMENAYFHSNNKTDEDVEFAIKNGVGYFVVDNAEELYAIDEYAGKYNIKQNVILRITPGIDTHTFEAVNTGKVDSKFGSAIETGQAEDITGLALTFGNINLVGFHCHVGSEVFDSSVFIDSAEIMLDFIKDMYDKKHFVTKVLDLGGGYGVRYIPAQPELDIASNIASVGEYVHRRVEELGIEMPEISFEPGRSIVADAGLTLYTVGTVKQIPDYKNYVSIDGGMTDNPRYALYGAEYTIVASEKLDEKCDMVCSLVGRCCESGDVIQDDITLPSSVKRGDIIACFTTGAYHYSMASNYNRIGRPAVVMLSKGKDYVAVKRETLDDLVSLDV